MKQTALLKSEIRKIINKAIEHDFDGEVIKTLLKVSRKNSEKVEEETLLASTKDP